MTDIQAPSNREEWLTQAMLLIAAEVFEPAEPGSTGNIANWRVSCGWPGGRGNKLKAIGQCWPPSASGEGLTEMFISPRLQATDSIDHVLVHEMVHASVGNEHGHKGPFAKLARKLGLEGKLTATTCGPALRAQLDAALAVLGPYPHAKLDLTASGRKVQTTRMLKAECGDCGYTIRTTAKWLEVGLPTCVCGGEFHQEVK